MPDKRRKELDAELEAATGDDGRPLHGADAKWSVSGSRYSYTVGAQPEVYTYNLELQEAEELRASAVEIEELVLVPTAYRERVDDGCLVATFVAEVAVDEQAGMASFTFRHFRQHLEVDGRGNVHEK